MPNNNVTNAANTAKKINLTEPEQAIAEKFKGVYYDAEWMQKPSHDDKEDYNNFLYKVYKILLSMKGSSELNLNEKGNYFTIIPEQFRADNKIHTLYFDKDESLTIKESLNTIPLVSLNNLDDEEKIDNAVSNVSIIDNEKPKPCNNFNPQGSTVEIHDASGELLGRIVDHGESLNPIVFASDKVAALETMRHAQLKGWRSVNLTGSDEFVQECMKYCVENNITPIITQDKQQKMLDGVVKKKKLKKKGLRM